MKTSQNKLIHKYGKQMRLAPIGISTYSRLNHLRQTIDAIQSNTLAQESEVFIFSDAPKAGDEDKVQAVRTYLKTIDGFKRVEIIERQTNSRTYNNRQGIHMLLDKYGKMIFMEEDVVTAPAFLEYMNYTLDIYEGNPRIFSIAGYCPPIRIPSDYPYDVFFHPRFNPWGFGIWKDRFDLLEMKIPWQVISRIFFNPTNLFNFSKSGLDVLPLVLNNYFEYADGLDVRIFPQQFLNGMFTVYPVRHFVDNIGLDGSGLHKKKKQTYRVPLSTESFRGYSLPVDMEPDHEIMRRFYKFRSGNYWNRIKLMLWSIWILFKRVFNIRGR